MEGKREKLGGRAMVRPGVLAAHLDWCDRRLGKDARPQVIQALPAEARALITGPSVEWCPFWILVAVDRTIARTVGGPPERVFHELGRHSAIRNWTEPYRAFENDEPHRFFEKTALWHDVFQDFGVAGYEKVGLHTGHFTLEACEEYSPVFCASALGYFEGALYMMGARGPFAGEETLCQCAGDPACLFVLHW